MAIQVAHAQGASWVEFDVKLTKDNIPILMHDDMLERTTNGRGRVADFTYEQIRKLDAGSWFNPVYAGEHVPTLERALDFVVRNGMMANIELKPCPGRARLTAEIALKAIEEIWPEKRPYPLVSSFDQESLQVARELQPSWPRGILLDEWERDWGDRIAEVDASTINLNQSLINTDSMRALLLAERPILAYTVNNPQRAKELLGLGVTAIFTDDPREILVSLGK
jgi:glycerophosphoryl diester phosphodiesterase